MRSLSEEALGDCFVVAGRYVLYGDDPSARLCHGTVTGQGPVRDRRFVHAWVEVVRDGEVMVVDAANGKAIYLPRDVYYRLGRIEPETVVRYDREAALIEMLRQRHWGPWSEVGS